MFDLEINIDKTKVMIFFQEENPTILIMGIKILKLYMSI